MNKLSDLLYKKLRVCSYMELLDAGLSYEDIHDISMNKLANWGNKKTNEILSATRHLLKVSDHELLEIFSDP